MDEDIIHLYLDGELIETTAEHPFYTDDGMWVDAADLTPGEHILSLDGDYGTVERVVVVEDANQPMYNLTVDEAHTFYVGEGDWLVHNCPNGDDVPSSGNNVGKTNRYGLVDRDKGVLGDNSTTTVIGRMDDIAQDQLHLDPNINTW